MSDEHHSNSLNHVDKRVIGKMSIGRLEELMAECSAEPTDFDHCLACYAYKIYQDRLSTPTPKDHHWQVAINYTCHPIDQTWGWSVTIDNDHVGTYASLATAIGMAARDAGVWKEVLES